MGQRGTFHSLAASGPYTWAHLFVAGSDYSPSTNSAEAYEVRVIVAGNLKVDLPDSTGVTIPVVAGDILKMEISKIYNTGTTATGITLLGFLISRN